jgi:hypothetical protein
VFIKMFTKKIKYDDSLNINNIRFSVVNCKENETKPILTKAIKQIANENIKQISEWRRKYPDCTESDSRKK